MCSSSSCSDNWQVKFTVKILEKCLQISSFLGLKPLTFINMNFFISIFQGYDCKFQSAYFPQNLSVAGSFYINSKNQL